MKEVTGSCGHISDMTSREFREATARVIDWITRYFENPEEFPVLSQIQPGDIKAALPGEPPTDGRDFEAILNDFENHLVKGVTHWNHPCFFAYFPCGASGAGIIGELLSATLGLNGMIWRTSPVVTELEDISLDYLRQMLGLASDFSGVIVDTASTSSLCALAAARESLREYNIREKGMAGRDDLPPLTLYMSQEAHSSIEKDAIVLGVGQENVRKIPVDSEYRMIPVELERNILADLGNGFRPFSVVATIGTTSSTAVDPVEVIADICAERGLWLHIDAAYAGSAAILPEKRSLFAGVNRADSLVVNPHKWLFTQLDCSALYCRKPDLLKSAFSLVPEYLTSSEQDSAKNLMDYGFQLGRRFRALKLWMVINYFGSSGLQELLRRHIDLAGRLASWIEESDRFEIMAPVNFSTVCFRLNPRTHKPDTHSPPESQEAYLNELNENLLNELNTTGRVFLSHTKLDGRYTLRCAIGNVRTEEKHVRELWNLLQEQADRLTES
jgi:aromatic-L-amino-acid decarboxylase